MRSRDMLTQLLLGPASFVAVLAWKIMILVDRTCCQYRCAESSLITISVASYCIRVSANVDNCMAVELDSTGKCYFALRTLEK